MEEESKPRQFWSFRSSQRGLVGQIQRSPPQGFGSFTAERRAANTYNEIVKVPEQLAANFQKRGKSGASYLGRPGTRSICK